MAKKSIKKNYVYNMMYQVLTSIATVVTTPYVARVLGADGVGTVSYAESIVAYFTLFATMGITIYGQREISYVQDSVEKRSRVFWNTKIMSFVISTITLLVYLGFLFTRDNKAVYMVLMFNILAVTVDVTWFFQGLEEFGKIAIRNCIFKIINIVYIFTVVRDKDDLVLYALGIALFVFISNASLWGYLPKYIKRVSFKELAPFRDFKVVLSLFVPTIAIQIYTVLDKTMIGIITSDSFENGYYEQAIKLSKLVLLVVTSLGTVMIPRIGYHFERKEMDEVKSLMYRGYRFVWFIGIPLCFGLMSVAENMVPWFFGDGYDGVVPLLKVLSLLIIIIGLSNVTGIQYLIPTKRQNVLSVTVILGAITNFCINIVLIYKFEALGAAIASIIAETVVTASQFFMIRKELSIGKILSLSIKYWVAGITMAVALFFEGKLFDPGIVNTMILAASGVAIYFIVLMILRDDYIFGLLRKEAKK